MSSESRRPVRFASTVAPGDTDTYSVEVEQAATVEDMTVRIYRGAELSLHILPFVERGAENRRSRIPLVEFRGKDFIDGDGDFFEFGLSEAVEENDVVGVEVTNTADEYAFDFAVNMSLDRAGGSSRLGGLIDSVQGWF
jgi:hypothetical protein